MKRLFLTCCAAAFLFASCSNEKSEGETAKDASGDTKKEEKKEEKKWVPVDGAAAMAAMMKNAQPGEAHKMLAKSDGTWDAEVTFWMGIDSPAMKSKGTAVNKMILDGRFQESKFSGDMGGMPFQGIATTGFDNATQEYVSTWIENMNTSTMVMKGKWDEASKSLVMTGTQTNPANGVECHLKQTLKFPDDNTQIMEMYGPDGMTGKEYKMVEIKYTRKK